MSGRSKGGIERVVEFTFAWPGDLGSMECGAKAELSHRFIDMVVVVEMIEARDICLLYVYED